MHVLVQTGQRGGGGGRQHGGSGDEDGGESADAAGGGSGRAPAETAAAKLARMALQVSTLFTAGPTSSTISKPSLDPQLRSRLGTSIS
jgi:hypothetical protein